MRNIKRWKASYTVEAAFIVPLFLGVIALAMRLGMGLYIEVKNDNEGEAVASMWEVDEFYKYQILKEVADE